MADDLVLPQFAHRVLDLAAGETLGQGVAATFVNLTDSDGGSRLRDGVEDDGLGGLILGILHGALVGEGLPLGVDGIAERLHILHRETIDEVDDLLEHGLLHSDTLSGL